MKPSTYEGGIQSMYEVAHDKALKHTQLHHEQADGYITLAAKTKNGFRQYHYKFNELKKQLHKWLGEDVYFSQNTFYKPQRQIENIRELRALYVDVDCYLLNYDPEWVVGKIDMELVGEKIPDPNLIIHSGRGIVLIWLLEPLPYRALPLWQALQNHFLEQLKYVGGDPKATDAARIFRVAGSINSKSGELVKVEYRHNYRYVLRDLQYEFLPQLEKRKKPKRGRPSKVRRLFNAYSLHHARLMDLTRLIEIRNYNVTGYRETMCFLYRYWLSCYTNDPQEALRQTVTLNLQFSEPLPLKEVERATRSAEKAFYAKNDAEANQIAKEKGYPGAGYNISNKKLIEWLDITSEEMKQLSTIIDKGEKNRRATIEKRKKRRSEGVLKRSEYISIQKDKTAQNLAKLEELLAINPKATRKELAKTLDVSVYRIDQLKRMLKEASAKMRSRQK